MSAPGQGDVWWAEEPDLGRRPMLVITRDVALPVLTRVLVAPVTRTVATSRPNSHWGVTPMKVAYVVTRSVSSG